MDGWLQGVKQERGMKAEKRRGKDEGKREGKKRDKFVSIVCTISGLCEYEYVRSKLSWVRISAKTND